MTPADLDRVFDLGVSYSAFKASLPDDGASLEDVERLVTPDPAGSAFERLGDGRILAIVEPWCRDSMDSLPVLAMLARRSPAIIMRIVHRDEHPTLMAGYLKDGRFAAIPVFLFLDAGFRERGRYVERPATVTRLRQQQREELAAAHPEFAPASKPPKLFDEPVKTRLKSAINELRARTRGQTSTYIVDALEEIAASAATDGIPPPVPSFAPIAMVDASGDVCEPD